MASEFDSLRQKFRAKFDPGLYQLRSEKGQPRGYASLDRTGKVPASQLPEDVDTTTVAGIALAGGGVLEWVDGDRLQFRPKDGETVARVPVQSSTGVWLSIEVTTALTWNRSVAGAGGMQPGTTAQANTGYEIRLITKTGGTAALLGTENGAEVSLPTAYTHASPVLGFASLTDGGSEDEIREFRQSGDYFWYDYPDPGGAHVGITVFEHLRATTNTALDLSAYLPAAAIEATFWGSYVNDSTTVRSYYALDVDGVKRFEFRAGRDTQAYEIVAQGTFVTPLFGDPTGDVRYKNDPSAPAVGEGLDLGIIGFRIDTAGWPITLVGEGGAGTVTSVTATAPVVSTGGTDPVISLESTSASKLFGRGSGGGAGNAELITLGTNLSMSGTTLNATGGGGSSDHGTLTGLGDDDHTQYALLAGRTTGQTLNGGTASAGDLTLDSTAHGTKGDVIIQPGGGATTVGDTLQVAGVIIADGDIVGGTTIGGDLTIDSTQHASKGNVFIQPGGGNVGIGDPIASRLLELHQALDVSTLLRVENENTSNSALAGVEVVADSSIVTFKTHSSTSTATLLGASAAEKSAIVEANGTGLIVATAGANPIQLGTNNVERLSVSSAGVGVWNETGADADFRAEGDTDANLLFLDAGNDRVGVGTASPATKADINGAVRVASYIEQAEQSAPSTPGSGFGRFYTNTSGKPHFINDAGTDYDISGSAAAGGSVQLIGSHDTAGAAETTVQFSVAALAAGYHWELYCGIENPTGGAVDYWLEFGSGGTLDTTGTNYFAQPAQFNNGAAIGSNRSNTPIATPTSAGDRCTIEAKIMRDEEPRTRAHIFATREDPANIILRLTGLAWNSTTNPTEVGIVAQTASGIGIGSWFRLYLVLGA